MYIVTRERALAVECAQAGADVIAERAGWRADPSDILLTSGFRDFRYIPNAELLLVPSCDPTRADLVRVARGMSATRSDALVVKAAMEGRRTLYCTVALWHGLARDWHHSRRLWLSRRNEAWLVPNPADTEESGAAFRLTSGRLRIAEAPPAEDPAEILAGLDRADAWLAASREGC